MSDVRFQTPQEAFWAGEFGTSYIGQRLSAGKRGISQRNEEEPEQELVGSHTKFVCLRVLSVGARGIVRFASHIRWRESCTDSQHFTFYVDLRTFDIVTPTRIVGALTGV